MSKSSAATRDDIEDVLQVLDVIVTKIDERFNKVETNVDAMHVQIQRILNRLDGIDKRIETVDYEQLVIGSQLTRLHNWAEQVAKRIDVKFVY